MLLDDLGSRELVRRSSEFWKFFSIDFWNLAFDCLTYLKGGNGAPRRVFEFCSITAFCLVRLNMRTVNRFGRNVSSQGLEKAGSALCGKVLRERDGRIQPVVGPTVKGQQRIKLSKEVLSASGDRKNSIGMQKIKCFVTVYSRQVTLASIGCEANLRFWVLNIEATITRTYLSQATFACCGAASVEEDSIMV